MVLLPPANEVCEGYVFTRVCLFRGGVPGQLHHHGQVHPRAGTPPAGTPLGRYTPGRYIPWAGTPPGQVHLPRQVHPPEQCMLGDTGNKRAVRMFQIRLIF